MNPYIIFQICSMALRAWADSTQLKNLLVEWAVIETKYNQIVFGENQIGGSL